MGIQEIRKKVGMSQREFAEYLEIPIGSLQNWEHNHRKPPEYLVKLIIKVLRYEKLLKD